ncbi:MAG: ATP-dependent zinc metalloprotease FtsH [Clostridium sp.]|nr:ATP-dependent zinc metalloprotease FtsH [Clostridium sp.]
MEQKPNNGKKFNLFFYLTLVLSLVLIVQLFLPTTSPEEISYSEFKQLVKEQKISKAIITGDRITITPKSNTGLGGKELYTLRVSDTNLVEDLTDAGVDFKAKNEKTTLIVEILINWVPLLLLMFFFWKFVLSKAMNKMGGGVGGIVKNKAKVYDENEIEVTFKDVAGQEEAKESLEEVIDFLNCPTKYTEIGAKLPKGVLLVGPPGTGKTLLAKAVAGEAKVPFFSLSGSSFVEMFVGVGASRVRELFRDAEQKAPCIIFIDEIDAIGKSRDNQYQSNDEREQTLNQLLSEMDGFDSSKGIVILGATNRPEILDKALLRPGRFDRRVIVDRPDLIGREAILKVHAKDVCLNADVDLKEIAKGTPGAVGADLANIVNEAALRAVRNKRNQVLQEDLREAVEVIIAGKEKKDRILSPMEKKIVAFHEVGHALVAALLKGTDPVHKITIVPRTMGALGYTMQLPEEEKYLISKDELMNQIKVMLGGRSAEEEVFNIVSTGASNDIERATQSARNMVTIYGMTDKFDMVGLESIQNRYLDGRAVRNCSEETSTMIDEEVLKIIREAHKEARKILRENRDLLDKIAGILLEKETIFGDEFMEVVCEKYPELKKEEKKETDEKQESINLSKESENQNTSNDETLDKKDGDLETQAEIAKDLCDDEFVEVGEKKYIDFKKDSEV